VNLPEPYGDVEPVRRLSSSTTVLYQVIFPLFCIGILPVSTLMTWVAPADDAEPVDWWLVFIVFLVVVFLCGFAMRLRTVRLRGETLLVTGLMREIEVPLRDVERVGGSRWLQPELMWIEFRRPTELGSRIFFLPPWRLFGGFATRHPLVRELDALVAAAWN
jgi:hypothetical protein